MSSGNEPIELTREEREAAAEAAYATHEMAVRGDGKYAPWDNQDWSQPKWRSSVDAAVAAINKVRAGDPVGTVRRSPGGTVAVKVRKQELAWELVVPGFVGGYSGTSGVVDWPVIYTPEIGEKK